MESRERVGYDIQTMDDTILMNRSLSSGIGYSRFRAADKISEARFDRDTKALLAYSRYKRRRFDEAITVADELLEEKFNDQVRERFREFNPNEISTHQRMNFSYH